MLALALALRFAALDFGSDLPGARPDEPGVVEGLRALHDGRLFPSLVLYGGGYFHPLHGYVAARSWLDGRPLLSLPAADWLVPTIAVRGWSAILSTATVLAVFACATRLAGGPGGLFAALLLAATPLAVREAHFAKADSAAAFAAALFLVSVAPWPWRARTRAVSIGAGAAFALSTKAVVGVVPAALLALARPVAAGDRRIAWRSLALGASVLAATVVALNAFWLGDPATAWTLARSSARALSRTDWLAGADVAGGPLAYHATVSLRHGCGVALAALSLPALGWGLWRDDGSRAIALFALVEWLKLLASPMVLARFFLPIVPALVVLSAVLATDLVDRFGPRSRAARGWLVIALGALASAAPLASSVAMVRALGRDDTRTLAARWIESELPRNAVIVTWGTPSTSLVEWGVPPTGGRRTVRAADPAKWARIRATHVLVHSYPLPHSSVAPPTEISGMKPLVVFDPRDGPTHEPVLEPLDAFYLPLARADGYVRPGPRIEIYELPR